MFYVIVRAYPESVSLVNKTSFPSENVNSTISEAIVCMYSTPSNNIATGSKYIYIYILYLG